MLSKNIKTVQVEEIVFRIPNALYEFLLGKKEYHFGTTSSQRTVTLMADFRSNNNAEQYAGYADIKYCSLNTDIWVTFRTFENSCMDNDKTYDFTVAPSTKEIVLKDIEQALIKAQEAQKVQAQTQSQNRPLVATKGSGGQIWVYFDKEFFDWVETNYKSTTSFKIACNQSERIPRCNMTEAIFTSKYRGAIARLCPYDQDIWNLLSRELSYATLTYKKQCAVPDTPNLTGFNIFY
jgi:hypothetical protein